MNPADFGDQSAAATLERYMVEKYCGGPWGRNRTYCSTLGEVHA